jgi:hypothetical protein
VGDRNEEISLIDLYAGQKVLQGQVADMRIDVQNKHSENRNSIHEIRGDIQDVKDSVWKLKIKMAGYSAIAGVATTLVVKLVDYAIKH